MSEKIVADDGHEGHWYTGEEIVRCRDCKYASYDSRWCYRLLNAEDTPITPDGFCAWGKRRDA